MPWKWIWIIVNVKIMKTIVRTMRSDAQICLVNIIVRTTRSDAHTSQKKIGHTNVGKHSWHNISVTNICLNTMATLSSPISHSQPISVHKITRYNVHKISAWWKCSLATQYNPLNSLLTLRPTNNHWSNLCLGRMARTSKSLDLHVHTLDYTKMSSLSED